ncbi:MAG: glycosyltransferase family 4 protein [Candidatus Sabulitectum sp.]|nr:glycosyltransferase family 4 protein [Candidatus Sabulitectum sp.]
MKILHLIHRTWPYHGGAERYVWEHALAAERWGHTSTVVTTDAWDMSWLVSKKGRHLQPGKFIREGIEIIRFPVAHPPAQNLFRALFRRFKKGGPDRFFYPNPFIPKFDKWISRADGFDLVHANAMPFLLHGGYRYAQKNDVPLVSVPHANLGSPSHRIEPLHYFAGEQPEVLRESKLVVAHNSFEASVYRNECGVKEENILILGSGIDPDEWTGADGELARRALSIPQKKKIVLSVTAHCRDKGSFTLLDSSIDLWKRGEDFILVLAGPVQSDFREYLDARSKDVPQGKLIVTGYVPEEIRKHLFHAAWIVTAPSRLDAFGIVLLDGWMAGKPVIGCNAGGMPDLVHAGENGFLVDFGDKEDLSEKISTLLKNEELAVTMGENGKRRTIAEYTWQIVTDRFYRELQERLK